MKNSNKNLMFLKDLHKYQYFTGYQALPGNTGPEALPLIFMAACEAEPLNIGSQAEPRNQFKNFDIFVGTGHCRVLAVA